MPLRGVSKELGGNRMRLNLRMLLVGVAFVAIAVAPSARAALQVSALQVVMGSISEGGTTSFLALSASISAGPGTEVGEITSYALTFSSGDGQSTFISGEPGGWDIGWLIPFTYANPGSFLAHVSGTISWSEGFYFHFPPLQSELFLSEATFTLDPAIYYTFVSVEGVAAPIPEPETYAMLLAGLALLGFVTRKRRTTTAAA
jgi:hypothetical protein